MLYRYKPESKNRYETIYGGIKRKENTTSADLPPLPLYGTAASAGTAAETSPSQPAQKTVYKTTAAKTVSGGTYQQKTPQEQQKELLMQQKKAAIEANRSQALQLLGANLASEKTAAGAANDDALRQLYVAYMNGIKQLPQQSALWGAGGSIESLKTQHRINYEDNRAKQNSEYAGVLGELQRRYNSDLLELEEKYLRQLMGL